MRGTSHVIGVIDDDASVRGALRRLFRTSRLDVSLFGTAEEYLADPSRAEVDCLVIDMRLPGMGGLELLEQIRANPVPCLLITAHEDEQARSQALTLGALGFFKKPFDNRELQTLVFQALGLVEK